MFCKLFKLSPFLLFFFLPCCINTYINLPLANFSFLLHIHSTCICDFHTKRKREKNNKKKFSFIVCDTRTLDRKTVLLTSQKWRSKQRKIRREEKNIFVSYMFGVLNDALWCSVLGDWQPVEFSRSFLFTRFWGNCWTC